jgi:hypothetical protein
MHRTGIMAPPSLHELPPRAGLMACDPHAIAHDISLRTALWCIAFVLAAVEVCFHTLGT